MQEVYGDGFAEHTTPDFEEVPMPPLADNDVYEDAYSPPTAASTGGYPPSPRATKSPSPKGMTGARLNIPGAGGGGGMQGSPIVKVEQFTPTHSTNGDNGNVVGVNMHPTPLSFNNDSTSTSSDLREEGGGGEQLTIKRGEDGEWSGGFDPTMRFSGELPFNLKELSIQQALDIKKAEIEGWLERNADASVKNPRGRTGSGSGGSGGLKVKVPKRIRAKSFSDLRTSRRGLLGSDPVAPAAPAAPVAPGESSAGNVAGVVVIDVDGDIDSSDEDSSVASSFNEGSLDDVLDDDESMSTSEAPPTAEELKKAQLEAEEEERRRLENDPAYFPKPNEFYSAHPWNDTASSVLRGARIAMKNQPHTANAAMMRFQKYAENIETASRVATFGSQASRGRRLSAGDADKTLVETGLLKRLSFGKDKDKDKDKESGHQRRPSIWGNKVKNSLKRGFSNAGDKDKGKGGDGSNNNEKSDLADTDASGRKRGDSTASSITSGISFGPPKSTKSWTKIGGLSLDTSVTSVPNAFAQMAGISAGVGKSSGHTSKPTSPSPPERKPTGLGIGMGDVMQALRRPRSKSELVTGSKPKPGKQTFGIVGLLGQYGGPPALPIKSPVGSGSSAGSKLRTSFTFGEDSRQRGLEDAKQNLLSPPDPHRHDGYDDDDDDMGEHEALPAAASGGLASGTRLPKLDITPNAEGFAGHVKEKTPNLQPKLVERIVYEQGKRYKKLVDHRQKHLAAIKNSGKCANGANCRGHVGAIGAGGQEEEHGHRRNVSPEGFEGEGNFLSFLLLLLSLGRSSL